jgi:hypothetical protein
MVARRSKRVRSARQSPERGGEIELGEEGFRLARVPSPPLWLPPVGAVPGLRKTPAQIQRENLAARQVPLCAPLLDVLF